MSAIRNIKVVRVEAATSIKINESTMETTNHADTKVLGSNCLPIHDFERLVVVSRWYTGARSFKCPTICGSIAYDQQISSKVYMFVYHQVIHCPILTSYLICPMQSQMARVRINNIPKFLAVDQYEKTHTIKVDDPLNSNEPLIILLALKGVTSYFLSRNQKPSEYEDEYIQHIDMTSKAPVWEPSETGFSEQEDATTHFRVEVIRNEIIKR